MVWKNGGEEERVERQIAWRWINGDSNMVMY